MADDLAAAQPAAAEAASTALDQISSESAIESMLGNVPGFDKYFGSDDSDKDKLGTPAVTAQPEVGRAGAEAPQEPAGITDEILSSGEAAKESSASPEAEKKPELPAAVQQRIDQLTAQRYEAKSRYEAAEAKVAELEARLNGPVAQTPNNPLGHINDMGALEKIFLETKEIKNWAIENLDGGQMKLSSGEIRDLSPQEVRKLLAMSEESLTSTIPQRKNFLDARAASEAQAKAYYPDAFKQGSQTNLALQAWMKTFPEILRFPDHKLYICDALVGERVRMQRQSQTNGSANGTRSRAQTLAAPSPASAPRVPQKSVLSSDLFDRIANNDRSALDMFSESLIGTGGNKS